MKPVIKYQGGKSKELSRIKEIAPKTIHRVVEPFCGGSAVSLHYGDTCVLNDINKAVINLYREVGGDNYPCLLYTSPSPRDATLSRMPSSA